MLVYAILCNEVQESHSWSTGGGEPSRQTKNGSFQLSTMAPAQSGFSWSNIAVGAAMNMFEVTSLGQPFEVVKTQMASNRSQTMFQALKTVWSRGGVFGFYQGLIPWVRLVADGRRGSRRRRKAVCCCSRRAR